MTIFLSSEQQEEEEKVSNFQIASELFLATIFFLLRHHFPRSEHGKLKVATHQEDYCREITCTRAKSRTWKVFPMSQVVSQPKKSGRQNGRQEHDNLLFEKVLNFFAFETSTRSCLIMFDGETRSLAHLGSKFRLIYKNK